MLQELLFLDPIYFGIIIGALTVIIMVAATVGLYVGLQVWNAKPAKAVTKDAAEVPKEINYLVFFAEPPELMEVTDSGFRDRLRCHGYKRSPALTTIQDAEFVLGVSPDGFYVLKDRGTYCLSIMEACGSCTTISRGERSHEEVVGATQGSQVESSQGVVERMPWPPGRDPCC